MRCTIHIIFEHANESMLVKKDFFIPDSEFSLLKETAGYKKPYTLIPNAHTKIEKEMKRLCKEGIIQKDIWVMGEPRVFYIPGRKFDQIYYYETEVDRKIKEKIEELKKGLTDD